MNFKRTIASLLCVLTALLPVTPAMAQGAASNLSFVAGRFIANRYNSYGGDYASQVYTGNASTGSSTITVRGGYITLSDGRSVVPFAVGVPFVINDANAELVTPTTVSGCYKAQGENQDGIFVSCSVTASFTFLHGQGAALTSGTGGLAEAVNDAFGQGGGIVVLAPGWSGIVNTSCSGCYSSKAAAIAGILAYPNVTIEDDTLGAPQYWTAQGGITTLAAPTTLTSTTVGFALNGGNATGGTYTGTSTYHVCISYVDIYGQEGPCSADFSGLTAGTGSTNQIGFSAPAASAGAVGYTVYVSLASGSYNLAYKVPLATYAAGVPTSNGVCTAGLTKLETVTAACPVTNTTYGQTGSAAVVSALTLNTSPIEAQSTVVSTTSVYVPNAGGRTTYAYTPGSHIGTAGIPMAFLPFTISAADATVVPSVIGSVNLPANFMNYLGRTVEVCGYATTSASTGTIQDIQFQWDSLGQNTAGKGVPIGDLTVTKTATSVLQITFCEDFQTTVTGTSATAGSIQNTGGYITSSIASLSAAAAGGNTIAGATASLDLANEARINVIYLHTTGTDGTAVTLQSLTLKALN